MHQSFPTCSLRILRVSCTNLFALSLLLLFVENAVGQEMMRTVEVEPQHKSDAIMISKVMVGNKSVECRLIVGKPGFPPTVQPITPFLASNDWLQNMVVSVVNRTEKRIAVLKLSLAFVETGDGQTQPQSVYPIFLGRIPPSAAINGRTGESLTQDPNSKPTSFEPHQEFLIRVGDYIDRIRETVEHVMPLGSVTKVFLSSRMIFFEDGMRWDGGGYAVPDPAHPGKFQYIKDRNFFPGYNKLQWPPGQGQ